MSVLRCTVLFLGCWATIGEGKVNYDGASVKEVADERMVHGEGPFWESKNNALYFVDIAKHRVYRLFQNRLEHVQLDEDVSFVIPVDGQQDRFVIGKGTTLAALRWKLNENTYSVENLITVDADKAGNRWNDAKVDYCGNLWAGTMGFENSDGFIPPDQGTLYKVSHAAGCLQNIEPVLPGVSVSNGLAWTKDGLRMFYIDSPTKQVVAFDYDPSEASISNRKVFFDFQTHNLPGVPDGMTIDVDDNIWVANYAGGQVLHISGSSGELLGKLKIKAQYVSSVTFGGPELDKLYVTTISRGVTHEQFNEYPMSGKVLEVTGLGVKGLPDRPANMKCFNLI